MALSTFHASATDDASSYAKLAQHQACRIVHQDIKTFSLRKLVVQHKNLIGDVGFVDSN